MTTCCILGLGYIGLPTAAIIADIVGTLSADDRERITIEPDRRAAIDLAVAHAIDHGMPLVIAGKGHEQVQLIGDRREPFCDLAVASACVDDRAHHLAPTRRGTASRHALGRVSDRAGAPIHI